ncbi:hypothetical protein Nepgr_015512 [Nepenthes gracilis]|uniref:Heat shock protein 90 n=1 Tax=Nepenthes gracilis TaxID=150966 RepID=A0AAD3SNP3_NEPGR|nr:hypothetical protein Nepgr_015512 [Nepenthes gracilis]
MERIMKSQMMTDANKQAYVPGKRVLEINLRHPIIKELCERLVKDPEDDRVKEAAQLIYQTALLESGFILDPNDFASRIYSSVQASLSISPNAAAEEEDDAEEPKYETETKEASTTRAETEDMKDEL